MPPSFPTKSKQAHAEGDSRELPLARLLGLSLPLSVELSCSTMTVQEVLRLGRGSVVHLDPLGDAPVAVYLGDCRFAEGEVVLLGDRLGIRITHVGSQPLGESAA